MEESAPAKLPQTGPDPAKVIDLLAKGAVIMAAVLYGCGFIVVSIYQCTYGLVQVSPLRPKVLAAGIWFFCFLAVPFLLVVEERRIKSSYPERERWLERGRNVSFFSTFSSFWLGVIFSIAFDLGSAEPKWPSTLTIMGVIFVAAGVIAVADAVAAKQRSRFP
jgi:hypothetical protein